MLKRTKIFAVTIALLLMVSTIFITACSCSESSPTNYNISKSKSTNGSFIVKVDDKETDTTTENSSVVVIPSPNSGYEVDEVYYTEQDSTSKVDIPLKNGYYTFTMPAKNITVYVTFKLVEVPETTYTISKNTATNGSFEFTVNDKSSTSATEGDTIKVIPSPDSDYEVDKVCYIEQGSSNEVSISLQNGTYAFTMPAKNITVYVTFKLVEVPETIYTISKNTATNGSFEFTVNDKSSTSATEGDTIKVIPSPDNGYELDKVYYIAKGTLNEVSIPLKDGTYSFSMPASDITIFVTFTKIPEADVSDFEFEESEDGVSYTITGYSGSDTNLVLPSEYNGKPVSAIGMLAFSSNETISSVYIPNTINYIGDSTFNSCTSLESVTFQKNSQLDTIGMYAFGSTGLTDICIPRKRQDNRRICI